jgi:hypothetical protein
VEEEPASASWAKAQRDGRKVRLRFVHLLAVRFLTPLEHMLRFRSSSEGVQSTGGTAAFALAAPTLREPHIGHIAAGDLRGCAGSARICHLSRFNAATRRGKHGGENSVRARNRLTERYI